MMIDPRRLLAAPFVYRAFSRVVRKDMPGYYINKYVRPAAGDRVLDIGCGPGDFLGHLPAVEYHGLDLSPEYVAAAKARWGAKGDFRCESVADTAVREPASYDIAVANGVLHHLTDAEARALFAVARAALKPGGRLVTIDGCFAPDQSRLARWVVSRDRGQFVRTEPAYLALAREFFPAVQSHLYHKLIRIPYTHLVMVCPNE